MPKGRHSMAKCVKTSIEKVVFQATTTRRNFSPIIFIWDKNVKDGIISSKNKGGKYFPF